MGISLLPVSQPLPEASVSAAAISAAAVPQARFATPTTPSAPAGPRAPAAVLPPTEAVFFASPQEALFESPVLPREEKIRVLAEMNEKQVKVCTRCRLSQTRTNTVFGEGDPDAAIFFIGEGPGETEDQTGRPFVGRAGQKLDEMIGAMGLKREQVFIANVVKCRPPENRAPAPDETDACTSYLERQLEVVRPKVIITLGLPATRYITGLKLSMTRMRGQWQSYRGIRVMPTFHPAYILRNYTVETRKAVWSDLQKVMAEVGLKPPQRGAGASG